MDILELASPVHDLEAGTHDAHASALRGWVMLLILEHSICFRFSFFISSMSAEEMPLAWMCTSIHSLRARMLSATGQ